MAGSPKLVCLDSELPDGGVSVVRFYAGLSQPIIDPFVHFGRLASGEGFHLHHVALHGGNYALALAVVAGTVAVAIIILTAFGVEAKGVAFGTGRIRGPAGPRTAASSDAI